MGERPLKVDGTIGRAPIEEKKQLFIINLTRMKKDTRFSLIFGLENLGMRLACS